MPTRDEIYLAIRNADKAGDSESVRKLGAYLNSMDGAVSQSAPQPNPTKSIGDTIKQGATDLVAGAVRGAGSIGATLLTPIDATARAFGIKNDFIGRDDRRQSMDNALSSLGADTTSIPFKTGKLATEIAGTAGIGGAVANTAKAVLPATVTAAPVVANVLRAVETSGMSGGALAPGVKGVVKNLATRSVGGGITGGLSAAAIDPSQAKEGAVIGAVLPPAIYGAGQLGSAVASGVKTGIKNTLGLTTGVGAEPISQAFKAGKTGNQTFLNNLKGDSQLTDVLDEAKAGLQAMNAAKSAEYRSGMIPIKGDKSVLSLDGISKAVDDAAQIGTYKGQVKNESANAAIEKMRSIVEEWKQLDPAEFHTPEGLDALKQKLGGIIESIPFNEKSARLAANKVYNATKAEIEAQAPTYAKVMKGYQTASDQISEIERALSLGDRASKDTAMRKLQSLMRNNVQTNYGNRLSLANTLEDAGGVELMPALSGQALNSWTPRSLAGQAGAGASMLMGLSNPLTLAALPFQSPRLVGSLAYGAGKLTAAKQAIPSTSGGKVINALANDPSSLVQFGYRSAPAIVADR